MHVVTLQPASTLIQSVASTPITSFVDLCEGAGKLRMHKTQQQSLKLKTNLRTCICYAVLLCDHAFIVCWEVHSKCQATEATEVHRLQSIL